MKYNSQVLDKMSTTEKYKSYYPIKKRPEMPVQTTTLKPSEASMLKTSGDLILQFYLIMK